MTTTNRSFFTANPLALDRKSVMFDRKSVIYKPANACDTGFCRVYKGIQRYEVSITKNNYANCVVDNSKIKPAIMGFLFNPVIPNLRGGNPPLDP